MVRLLGVKMGVEVEVGAQKTGQPGGWLLPHLPHEVSASLRSLANAQFPAPTQGFSSLVSPDFSQLREPPLYRHG